MVTWITDQIGVDVGPVNIGVIQENDNLLLVDTGIDNSAVNKVRKSLEKDVTGALITHHHADHMGGANKLEKLGVTELYGPELELPFIKNTLLEPMTMFGGAFPPQELRNRHLEARSAPTVRSSTQQNYAKVISCPGHTPDHQSYLFGDIIFTGDSAFTQETIDKYNLLFAVDPRQASESIQVLEDHKFDVMIPGHGPIQESRKEAMQVLKDTKRHYQSTSDKILSIIGERLSLNQFLSKCMNELHLAEIVKERGYLQYILYQVPLQGYLSNLMDMNKVNIEIQSDGPQIIAN